MIKVALCDDDKSILNEVHILLDRYRVKRNKAVMHVDFHSPLDLLAEIKKGIRFDILILDVFMKEEDGISTAKEIRRYDGMVKIIFLTSSPEFTVQSYAVGAFLYQTKPIWEDTFLRLMDSAVSDCKKAQPCSLVLHCKKGDIRIELERLEYCEETGRTLLFHMENGNVIESAGSLDELLRRLVHNENFLRPHQSFLINMEYIQSISCHAVTMLDRAEIPIGSGKYYEIKDAYLKYAFSRKQVLIS